jgi:hypothetical protein
MLLVIAHASTMTLSVGLAELAPSTLRRALVW